MKKALVIIISLSVLFIAFLLTRKPAGIEGKYTNKDLICSCHHKGYIIFENGEIFTFFEGHGTRTKAGIYKLITDSKAEIDIKLFTLAYKGTIELSGSSITIPLPGESLTVHQRGYFWW